MAAFAFKSSSSSPHLVKNNNLIALVSLNKRAFRDPPKYNEEDADKINKLSLDAYLDDLMKRRPANEAGFINLPRENFKNMVMRAKSEKDLQTLTQAHVNFLGHRSILP